ncbi:MAG: hypothetical protein EA416_02905, partial [Trueperaceae bacterium]
MRTTRHPTRRSTWLWFLVAALIAGCASLPEASIPDEAAQPAADEQETLEVQGLTSADSLVGDAFRFLEPLASNTPDPDELDTTLTDFLSVEVCLVANDDCTLLATLDADGIDSAQLRLEDDAFYMVNWTPGPSDIEVGATQRIAVLVAGAEIGQVERVSTSRGDLRRTLPIRFHVEDHPVIRVRVLNEQGFSASEIAQVLLDDFGLPPEETARLLAEDLDPFGAIAIAEALDDVYDVAAEEAAAILRTVGFDARDVTSVLDQVYGLAPDPLTAVLASAGFDAGEITDALDAVLELGEQVIAAALQLAGFGVDAITGALSTVLGLPADVIATALAFAGFGADAITGALSTVLELQADVIAAALDAAGFGIDLIVGALDG